MVTQLQARLSAWLDGALPAGAAVALVDFPGYLNCGDHAIWIGQKRLLAHHGAAIVYECSRHNYLPARMRELLGRDGYILMQGGGNFGDLYPHHQMFREQILTDFPDNPVICFPQSIFFRDHENLERARRKIAEHGKVMLTTRDVVSQHVVERHLRLPSTLLPDAAFGMGPLARPVQPAVDVVCLLRQDDESIRPGTVQADKCRIAFPVGADGIQSQAAGRISGKSLFTDWSALSVPPDQRDRVRSLGMGYADFWFARASHLLSMGRMVITDRLHGHIICMLLGLPHILINNSYGKNFNLFETWTRGSPLCRLAFDLDEARAMADAMLADIGAGAQELPHQ